MLLQRTESQPIRVYSIEEPSSHSQQFDFLDNGRISRVLDPIEPFQYESAPTLELVNKMKLSDQTSGKRVFLSYAHQDQAEVKLVQEALAQNGFQVYSDYPEMEAGANWSEALKYRLEASDFVLLFLSRQLFQRDGLTLEYANDFLDNIKRRNINLIPVKMDNVKIPSNLMEFEWYDFTGAQKDTEGLVRRIKMMDEISFEKLSPVQFEELIYSLLQHLEFRQIQWNRKVADDGFDFIAEHFSNDPFGQKEKEIWLIECKYYKQARFDLKTLKQIISDYKYIRRKDAKLVLITNSQFNSVAMEFLNEVQHSDFIDIKTIDGFQLKNILTRFPSLVNNYFAS